eukprot:scaffold42270_cov30-Tisochrysis_lutea.AAC.7
MHACLCTLLPTPHRFVGTTAFPGLQRHLELLLVRFQQPFCNGKLGTSAKVDVDAALSLESPVKLLAQAIAHTSVGELVSKA